MEIVVSVFAVLVGLVCFYAIWRSDKKDMNKGDNNSGDNQG